MTGSLTNQRRELSRVIEQRCAGLGLRACCPHLVFIEGTAVEFAVYLPDIGGAQGLLIDVVVEPDYMPSEEHKRAAENSAIPVSFVNPACWSTDAGEFMAALRDWGYFGRPEDLSDVLRAELVSQE